MDTTHLSAMQQMQKVVKLVFNTGKMSTLEKNFYVCM